MAITITRTPPPAPPTNVTASPGTATGDLTPGKTYYYRLKIITNYGTGRESAACAEVSAVASSSGSIDLSWTENAKVQIWRTPNSGDYSYAYNDGNNLDHDKHCMFLNGGNKTGPWGGTYTVEGTSFTDVGTASERTAASTCSTYYRWFCNYKFREWGRGDLYVEGGTEDNPATFDDIYNADQTNGWNTFLKADTGFGTDEGIRVFTCRDNLYIHDHFKDSSFILKYHGGLYCHNDDGGVRTFGIKSSYDEVPQSGGQFIAVGVGRHYYHNTYFRNTNLYNIQILSDWEECQEYKDKSDYRGYESGMILLVYDNCEWKNVVIDATFANGAKLRGTTGINWDYIWIIGNSRGIACPVDQSANSFNHIFLANQWYDLCYYQGGSTATVVKIKNPRIMYRGNSTGRVRFWNERNKTFVLVNPVIHSSISMPAAISQGGGAYDCSVIIKYEFDLKVVDEKGNGIENAIVKLIDGQGNETVLTTAADGTIDQQELIAKEYCRSTDDSGPFDTTVDYSSYILKIQHPKYIPLEFKFILNEKVNWTATLKRSTINTDQETIL